MSLSILSLGGICVNGALISNSSTSELLLASGCATKVGRQMTQVLNNELETHHWEAACCCWCYLKSLSLVQLETHPATFDKLGKWEDNGVT